MTVLERDLTPDDIEHKVLRNPIRVVSVANVDDAILGYLDEGKFTDRGVALTRARELSRLHPELLFAVGPVIKPTGRILHQAKKVMLNFEGSLHAIWGGPYKVNVRDGLWKEIIEAK